MDKNLATCTPTDLLVHMESHWLPNHAARRDAHARLMIQAMMNGMSNKIQNTDKPLEKMTKIHKK